MAKQTFNTGQVLTAAQMTSLQQTAMLGGSAAVKTTSYVLVAADAGTSVAMNSTSATTVTVNTGLFAAGDTVTIINQNTGVCTVTAGTATVRKASGASLALSQYQGGVLDFISASEAIFFPFDVGGGASPLTTKGDLFTFSTTDTRLGIGTTNQVLTVDPTTATGMKWATPAGGGKVLQVVSATYQTEVSGTTSTLTDSGLTASITPSATTSKVLILVTQRIYVENVSSSQNLGFNFALLRGATKIVSESASGNFSYNMPGVTVAAGAGKLNSYNQHAISFLDSPSTTSSTTYKTQVSNTGGGFFAAQQGSGAPASSIILLEIGA